MMNDFKRAFGLLIFSLSLVTGLIGAAQTLPMAPVVSFDDVVLENYHVRINAENQIAQVNIEQTYSNPTNRILEEIYIFPVPKETTISSLTLCIGDESCTEGQLLDAQQAQSIYQELVRRTRDPALLEYLDERSFQVRIFPINPGEKQSIKINYQQVLQRQNDLIEILYPITSQKLIKQMLIETSIKSDQPIGNVYSPSHTLSQTRISDNEVKASFEASDLKSDEDFRLYYAVAQDGVALNLISFQPSGEDGYFLMLVSWPKQQSAPLPKDIVFIVDTSGSMSGEKIEQAKESLRFAIKQLNPDDRVGIVTFSDVLHPYKNELIEASKLDQGDLATFINGLAAEGGTNIDDALQQGLHLLDASSERPKLVIFLTDGLPTSGETSTEKIIGDFQSQNLKLNTRIFTFGVGYDVNTILLDTLSGENGGFTTYVEPGENLESAVSHFYNRVGTPLLWGLTAQFDGLDVYDLYPGKLPDLFAGDMLEIAGRYHSGGKGHVVLKGQGSSQPETFSHDIDLSTGWTEHDYLPKIWAARAVGYLLTQIHLHGGSPELVDRVRQLGEKYGIITPYTSYLAPPEQDDSSTPIRSMPMQAPSGQGAVKSSEALNTLSKAASGDELDQFSSSSEKHVGEKSYQYQNGTWTQSGLDKTERDLKVQFGSEAYFALAKSSALREVLKLGSNVVFTAMPDTGKPITIEIGDTGIATSAELPLNLQQSQQPTPQNDNTTQQQTQVQTPSPQTQSTPWAMIALAAGLVVVLAGVAFWLIRR
jgi:Ca-activated chloride channel family protein